jgi:SAM-dependent methyltransferase
VNFPKFVQRLVPKSFQATLRQLRSRRRVSRAQSTDPVDYWTRHHVAAPDGGFSSVDASLAHYTWRNHVNPGHLELMPVNDVSGKVVLDYGCGPGNDVIGFGHFGKPARLLACDVSPTALALARRRAALHTFDVEFSRIADSPVDLPYESASIDVIHSAGVLHHTSDPAAILREFRRVLRPNGEVRIMVYNRNSLWMHLYVSYILMIEQGLYAGMSPDEAFPRSTDGEDCPIARCYRPEEFVALGAASGLTGKFVGAGITLTELELLPRRWQALADPRIAGESREFLYELTFDNRGWPRYRDEVAGVNAYYRFRPA